MKGSPTPLRRLGLAAIALASLMLTVSCVKSSATNQTECSSSSECQAGALCLAGRCVGPGGDVVVTTDTGTDTSVPDSTVSDTQTDTGLDMGSDTKPPTDTQVADMPTDTTVPDAETGDTDVSTPDTADTTVSGPKIVTFEFFNPHVELDGKQNPALVYLLGATSETEIPRLYLLSNGKLSLCGPPLTETKSVMQTFRVSETGRLVFTVKPDSTKPALLASTLAKCSVPLPDPKQLSPVGINADADVPWFATVGNDMIVFAGDFAVAGNFTLHIVPADGSTSAELISKTDVPATVYASIPTIGTTKDQNYLYFVGNDANTPTSKGIYAIDLTKKTAVALTGVTNKTVYNPQILELSGSNQLIYTTTDVLAPSRTHLWRVPVDASAQPGPLSTAGDNYDVPSGFTVSPHGKWVAFRETEIDSGTTFARVVDATALTPAPITVELPNGATPLSFTFSHDNKLLFTLYQLSGKRGIISTDLALGTSKPLVTATGAAIGPRGIFVDTAKGSLLVWGDLEKDGVVSLHRVTYTGATSTSLINLADIPLTGGVTNVLDSDKGGTKVIVQGNLSKDNVEQLYVLEPALSKLTTVWANPKKIVKFSVGPAAMAPDGSGMIAVVVDHSVPKQTDYVVLVEF